MPSNRYYPAGSIPLTASGVSPTFDTELFTIGSVQCVWAGADKADGTIMPQGSNDGTSWTDLLAAGETITAGAGSYGYAYNPCHWRMVRVSIDHGTNAAGTIAFYFMGKV